MSDSSTTSSVNSSQPTNVQAAAQSASTASSNKIPGSASQLPASTPISSLENLKSLDANLYNQWSVLFAQALITDGQRYERRVEEAMRQLREGQE